MTPHRHPLSALADGTSGMIDSLRAAAEHLADSHMVRRLGELGFLPGERITLLRRGPGGREPIAVQVGDTVFALRRIEADCVLIEVNAPLGA